MADKKIKVKVDVETNTEDSINQLKALKRELKNVAAGSDEFKRIYNQIDDLEDKIKSAKNTSSDWVDTLESAGGPLGAVGGALNKLKVSTQSFGAALKATGIGLIVSLLGGLVAAFSQTEGSMKQFEPIIIAFQKTLGGVLSALQPLIDGFIELALKVMPYVTQAFKVAYSAVTAVFQSLGKIGEAVGKLIKGDFSGAWDSAKQSVTGFANNFEKAEARFEEGYKKTTKTQKENLDKQREAAQKALDEKLKRLEVEDKLDEARLEKLKAEAMAVAETEQQKLDVEETFAKKSYELRKKDLEDKQKLYKKDSVEYKAIQAELIKLDSDYTIQTTDFAQKQQKIREDDISHRKDQALAVAKTEQDKLDAERKAAEELYNLRKSTAQTPEALKKLDDDRLVELQVFADRQTKLAEDFAKKTRDIRTTAINDETERAKQARADKYADDLAALEADKQFILKSEEEKQQIRVALKTAYNNDIAKIDTDARVKAMNDDLVLLQAQQRTLTEGTKAFLDNSIAIENEAYAIKLLNAKDNAKQIEAVNVEHEQNLKDIKLRAAIAEKQIQLDRLQVIAGIGNSLAQLAGKNKALAIAAIAIEKAAAIGSIIVNTQIANLKAVAASPLTFGQPWVTINTIAGVLAGAAAIASGVQAVQQINAVQIPGATGGSGGSAGGPSSVQMPSYAGGPPSIAAPQIQTTGGQNPTAQLGETIANSQKPLRAYVVSQDIQNQSALDRRTNRAATFSGG